MGQDLSTDLMRWTFSTAPEKRGEIESYLNDLGLDVTVHEESRFTVSWEEPDLETDEIIQTLWEMNGETFEVTQEQFHRLSHLILHADDEGGDAAAEAQAA